MKDYMKRYIDLNNLVGILLEYEFEEEDLENTVKEDKHVYRSGIIRACKEIIKFNNKKTQEAIDIERVGESIKNFKK